MRFFHWSILPTFTPLIVALAADKESPTFNLKATIGFGHSCAVGKRPPPLFSLSRVLGETNAFRMINIQHFKTNINCGSCVRSVTPFLDEVEGVTIWRVDVEDARKVLTVEGTASEDSIVRMVEEAGFDIQPLAEELN